MHSNFPKWRILRFLWTKLSCLVSPAAYSHNYNTTCTTYNCTQRGILEFKSWCMYVNSHVPMHMQHGFPSLYKLKDFSWQLQTKTRTSIELDDRTSTQHRKLRNHVQQPAFTAYVKRKRKNRKRKLKHDTKQTLHRLFRYVTIFIN